MSSLSWRIRHRIKQLSMRLNKQPLSVPVPAPEPGPPLVIQISIRKVVCGLHGPLMAWGYPRPISPEGNLDSLWSLIDAHQQHATVRWVEELL